MLVTDLGPSLLTYSDEEALAGFILRMALSESSTSSYAVLQGILAIASLQLYGDSEGSHYKARVISSLRASINIENNDRVVLQNLTATMLLCLYEVFRIQHAVFDER